MICRSCAELNLLLRDWPVHLVGGMVLGSVWEAGESMRKLPWESWQEDPKE